MNKRALLILSLVVVPGIIGCEKAKLTEECKAAIREHQAYADAMFAKHREIHDGKPASDGLSVVKPAEVGDRSLFAEYERAIAKRKTACKGQEQERKAGNREVVTS